MGVSGSDAVRRQLTAVSDEVKAAVRQEIRQGAEDILAEMKRLTPVDASSGGPHVRDALRIDYAADGLKAQIGLPSDAEVEAYFWFRFLNDGTKGGTVAYRRGGKRYAMTVPKRAALRILERAVNAKKAPIISRIAALLKKL